MDLREYPTATEFLAEIGGFLAERETEHNVLIGVAGALARDPERPPAFLAAIVDGGQPELVMLMTPPHRLVVSQPGRSGPAAASEFARLVVPALAGRWPTSGVLGPAEIAHRIADEWRQVTGQTSKPAIREWIYRVTRVSPPAAVPGQLRPIDATDRERLLDWMAGFVRDALHEESAPGDHVEHLEWRLACDPPTAFVWDHDGARSLAMATGPTPHGIRVNWVYTPPEHRGRGYARACVAALSARLLAEGREWVALFADADYPTSNFVYQSIGFERVAEVQEIDFLEAEPTER